MPGACRTPHPRAPSPDAGRAAYLGIGGWRIPSDYDGITAGDLSLSKYLRGAMTGEWKSADAKRQTFRAALSGDTGGAGGFLLPTILTTSIIDLARSKTRVIEAGATVVPMANRKVDVPKWTGDPEPSWRSEGDAIAEDDATIDKLTLEAKSLAVL